jgi:hypothetical protein
MDSKSPPPPAEVVVSPARQLNEFKVSRAVALLRLDYDLPNILDDLARPLYTVTRPPCPERQRLLDYMKALYAFGPLIDCGQLVSIAMCALYVCLLWFDADIDVGQDLSRR